MPRRPFSTALGALALVSLLALASSCTRAPPLPPLTGSGMEGQPLSLQLLRYPDGPRHDLAKERGSVVLLDVWATWCEPCRESLPMYQDLAKEYGPRGLRVWAINVDEEPSPIAPFLQEVRVALPILLDPDGLVVERDLRVQRLPTTFLIDRRGVIRFVHESFAPEFLARYQSEIEQLLEER